MTLSPCIWRGTLASNGHCECQLLSPPYPSLCCTEQKGWPPSLPPHFVPSGAMEREQDWNKTCTSYIYSPIFLKLPSRFSNEVAEQCICSVPGRILPLADIFLGRISYWVCYFIFQASSRWLTNLISSGNSSAPVLPSWPLYSHSMGQFQSFLMHNCHSYSES